MEVISVTIFNWILFGFCMFLVLMGALVSAIVSTIVSGSFGFTIDYFYFNNSGKIRGNIINRIFVAVCLIAGFCYGGYLGYFFFDDKGVFLAIFGN